MSETRPFRVAHREARMRALQRRYGIFPGVAVESLADIAADAEEAFALESRSDVVEHGADESAWMSRPHHHREKASPRGADHSRPFDCEEVEKGDRVGELNIGPIGPRVPCVTRTAAAAIVRG